jgi:hypothetical protein
VRFAKMRLKSLLLIILISYLNGQIWEKIDSLSFEIMIPAGSEAIVCFIPQDDSLSAILPSDGLTDHAREAIECAPRWLREDLIINLSRLPSQHQDQLADLLLAAPYPYGDEVGFQVAHLPSNIITNPSFNPQVLYENALSIYSNDSALDYVTVVDSGTPGCGGNYYSTLVYKVLENGDTLELSLPREIYYWYVVFPKCQEEFPGYIDPNTGNPAPPPQGVFWRDYLFNHADPGYPLLREFIGSAKTLWNNLQDSLEDNGALGLLALWVDTVMTWGSPPFPRLPQPVYVYHHHGGTCSEYGWLTTGAGRAVLIPMTMTVAFRNNHKWNEFWERGWHQYEPFMRWINHPGYDPGWWELLGNFDWRGDGFIHMATDRYTAHCTLTIYVRDLLGNPVDGATVKIDGPGFPGPWVTLGFTGSDGIAEFLLGDNISYFTAQVISSIGNVGPTTVINNSQAGHHYEWEATLNGVIDTIPVSWDTIPQNPLNLHKIEIHFESPYEVIYGTNLFSSDQFYKKVEPGSIDFFICDSNNFSLYESGNPFYAFLINENSPQMDTEFVFPWEGKWYLLFTNKERVSNGVGIRATVYLYKNLEAVEEFHRGRASGLFFHIEGGSIFRRQVQFKLYLENKNFVRVCVYSASGRLINKLIEGNLGRGLYKISWNGKNMRGKKVPPGVYFVRLERGGRFLTQKVLLIR